MSVHCDEDPWEKYYLRFEEPDCPIVPVGCVLTMAGTGSEMNAGAVITDPGTKLKIGRVFGDGVMPRFSVLDPTFTFSLPKYQMAAGIYDIFNHICEQYFSGEDDSTSDYLAEALMKSVVHSSRIAIQNPKDYEARSNIMWAATWALNTLIACGKSTDWMVHMLGQAVGGFTDATHGMTLSAVSLPYYRMLCPHGLPRFARFAKEVWGIDPAGKSQEELAAAGLAAMEGWIDPAGKSQEELAAAGLAAMEGWMKELGLALTIGELGATEEMLEGIADATIHLDGGYKILSREDILQVLRESL